MFGIVLGIATLTLMVYELMTREGLTPAQQAEADARSRRAGLTAAIAANAGLPMTPAIATAIGVSPAVAAHCGLQYSDVTTADAWSIGYLGASLALPARLEMMKSVVPQATWPPAAQRVYCAFVRAS